MAVETCDDVELSLTRKGAIRAGAVDEIPAADKGIDDVLAAQIDPVEAVARLKTLLGVKG